MKFSDFFVGEAVVPELQAKDRNGVIRELVASLAAAGKIDEANVEAVTKAVIKRENAGSTGFGRGVAVPHEKLKSISDMVATIGLSSAGVDFAALDRAPVYSVVLLLSPADNPDQHLAAMENIFRQLQRDSFRRFLRQATTREEIVDLVQEVDDLPDG
jgi:mannitol/fructose-specific phosphotransferase system IIA component (Ntr-type)